MKKLGFTLIELLVVISIIGVLVAVAVASYNSAQIKARDAARRAIIGNIQTAFEQYFAETGAYPTSGNESVAFEGGIPKDPKGSANPLTWNTLSTSYCVCATLEAGVGNAIAPSSTTCNWSDTGTYYCATNKQ